MSNVMMEVRRQKVSAKASLFTFGEDGIDGHRPADSGKTRASKLEALLKRRAQNKKASRRTGTNLFLEIVNQKEDGGEEGDDELTDQSISPGTTRRRGSTRRTSGRRSSKRGSATVKSIDLEGVRKLPSGKNKNPAASPAVRDKAWDDHSDEHRSLRALQKIRMMMLQKHKGLQSAFEAIDSDRSGYLTQGK